MHYDTSEFGSYVYVGIMPLECEPNDWHWVGHVTYYIEDDGSVLSMHLGKDEVREEIRRMGRAIHD